MFYDIFSSLCIIHKTTPAAVAKELEITNAAVSKWRQGAIPRDFTLRKIADYFDVTVDYLLEEEREKTFWENYSKLCSERGESPNSIAAQLGYSSGSVTAWKQGRVPKYQTLEVIAKHFGVSVEYLLKEQEKKPSETEDLEAIRVALFGGDAEVTPEMWEEVKQFAHYVAARKKFEKK